MIMIQTPPMSPVQERFRPRSAMIRPAPRSNSRISMVGGGKASSRASDEEVKTTVQVAVRVRPPLNSTDPGFDLIPQRFQKSMVHVPSPTSLAVDSPPGRRIFIFDRVFGEETTQDGVWDYVSSSVDSFLQGYNVSVMAYGQSGAGKSFTMGTSGPSEQDDQDLMGIIPRAANTLFSKLAQNMPSFTRAYSGMREPNRYSMSSVPSASPYKTSQVEKPWQLKATYVEIYNEQLRDLLVPESTPANERQTVTIREDTKGRIILTGLHQVNIDSAEDLLEALNVGSTIRQTDATAINARSSRSHAVFSLNLVQRKTKAEMNPLKDKRMSMPADAFSETVSVDSKLHFVDLAGSERLKNTQASGERAKEGISINAGLANLGKVIAQLSSRHAGAHVSYRDSKLTRLLQDSLGGNAITYMIACVTPAEFHLSETLNTVQYASRARAIQTKPQIQQVDDGDKQAIIDRLRAEIHFLRDQIRSAESDTKPDSQDRQRSIDRELDLQNRLLDLEENYSTLSQRHAKLMSDMTKDRQEDGDDMTLPNGTRNDNAVDRIKRSTSFADAVEQVVLEYEKTIQSLESSLSKTRSTLSASESALLEKETRCAYTETMNQQLQARFQKLISRETQNEQYIHDMELKLEGAVGGEERQSLMLSELRKEILRLREFENTSEDYIAGLEDKLAESTKNSELLHREVTRLEETLERQRSLGRVETHTHGSVNAYANTNGVHTEANRYSMQSARSHVESEEDFLEEAIATPIPEDDLQHDLSSDKAINLETDLQRTKSLSNQSTAQSKFLSEKLEVVNQELFGLRVDHEATLGEYDLLSAKYDEALRTLAALQDSMEDSRNAAPSPFHFLSEEGANDGQRDGKQSSSRSLSLELSSLGQSTEATELTESAYIHHGQSLRDQDSGSREIEKTGDIDQSRLLSRQSAEYSALQQRYEALHDQHLDTLDLVEELKAEVQKVKHAHSNSGSSNNLIRRKSTQNLLNVDRAHRSIASLENIASDNFADNPDLKDSFHLSLGNITHELHQRTERVQELESDLANTKKELDTKMTIISGLTRERTKMASATSPVEMSMLSTMQDQIVELERQLASFHQDSGSREQELMGEISSLRKLLDAGKAGAEPSYDMPGALPPTPSEDRSLATEELNRSTDLETQLASWQEKHIAMTKSMQESEAKLLATISELENTLSSVENDRKTKISELNSLVNSNAAAAAAFELEREKHDETVQQLKKDVQSRATTIGSQASRLVTMEISLTRALSEIQQHTELGQSTMKSLDAHKDHIQALEAQLAEHQAIVKTHKDELTAMQDNHQADLEARRASTLRGVEGDVKTMIDDLHTQHAEQTTELKKRIQDLESSARDKDAEIEEHKRKATEGSTVIETLQLENKTHNRTASEALDEIRETKDRLQQAEEARQLAENNLVTAQARVEELQWAKKELNTELEEVRLKEQRASRLVEELEGQLHNTFEHSRNATSRLSHLQNARDQDLVDARTALIKAQEESSSLRSRIEQLEGTRDRNSPISPVLDSPNPDRTNSLTSQFRKTNVTSLPSPPPTQPLPPIPTNPRDSRSNGGTSPSGHRMSQHIHPAQQVEERDARIRTMEKHLKAEKQLTSTLEEALSDLESQVNKTKKDLEAWKNKAWQYEHELGALQKERQANRQSLQQVEEAKIKQREAEVARQHLEERMAALNKKKKKGGLNCF